MVTFYQIDLNSNAIMVEIYDRFVNSDRFVPHERGNGPVGVGVFMIVVFCIRVRLVNVNWLAIIAA